MFIHSDSTERLSSEPFNSWRMHREHVHACTCACVHVRACAHMRMCACSRVRVFVCACGRVGVWACVHVSSGTSPHLCAQAADFVRVRVKSIPKVDVICHGLNIDSADTVCQSLQHCMPPFSPA